MELPLFFDMMLRYSRPGKALVVTLIFTCWLTFELTTIIHGQFTEMVTYILPALKKRDVMATVRTFM